jgi:hypothetical protein
MQIARTANDIRFRSFILYGGKMARPKRFVGAGEVLHDVPPTIPSRHCR